MMKSTFLTEYKNKNTTSLFQIVFIFQKNMKLNFEHVCLSVNSWQVFVTDWKITCQWEILVLQCGISCDLWLIKEVQVNNYVCSKSRALQTIFAYQKYNSYASRFWNLEIFFYKPGNALLTAKKEVAKNFILTAELSQWKNFWF